MCIRDSITTANTLDTIPAPLLDRMEILRLSGYSEEEQTQIAKRYLLPKLLQHTGLTAEQCVITDGALQKVIESYTREAGVRRLEPVSYTHLRAHETGRNLV